MNTTEHLLACLAEECAEVAQRCSKALRFGLKDVQAGQALDNRDRLLEEVTDLRAVIELCEQRGIIPTVPTSRLRIVAKQDRVRAWMKYARKVGTLTGKEAA